jgi:chemotaxis protein MotB
LAKELADQTEQIRRIRETYDQLVNELRDEIAKGEIRVNQIGDELTIQMEEQVLFDSGRAEIKKNGRDVLTRIAPILVKAEEKRIRVLGHTDNVPISKRLQKTFPTNWELSAIRAANVVRFLQEVGHVPPERLVLLGFGEYKPVESNDSAEGRKQNRRVEINLVPTEALKEPQHDDPAGP